MENGIIDNIFSVPISNVLPPRQHSKLDKASLVFGDAPIDSMQLLTRELASLPVDFKPLNFLYRGIRKLKYLWKNFLEDFVQPPKKCNLLLLPLELKQDEVGTPCTGIRSDEEFREIGLLGTVYK